MSAGLATFALSEFTRRRDALREAVRCGEISEKKADHKADIWLAIACATGADCAEMYIECIYPFGRTVKRHWFHIAAPEDCRAALDRARNYAARKALRQPENLKAQQHAWDLEALACHHGLTPVYAAEQQEAA